MEIFLFSVFYRIHILLQELQFMGRFYGCLDQMGRIERDWKPRKLWTSYGSNIWNFIIFNAAIFSSYSPLIECTINNSTLMLRKWRSIYLSKLFNVAFSLGLVFVSVRSSLLLMLNKTSKEGKIFISLIKLQK